MDCDGCLARVLAVRVQVLSMNPISLTLMKLPFDRNLSVGLYGGHSQMPEGDKVLCKRTTKIDRTL